MTDTCSWYFPPDHSGQFDGFNDSGIETFLGNPICHLAREINQNALDAGNGKIVDVQFMKREIATSEIPNFEELKIHLSIVLKSLSEMELKQKFFLKTL